MFPDLNWKDGRANLLLITIPKYFEVLRIAFKCNYGAILDVAGSINFPFVNCDLFQFEVIVGKLYFVVVVDPEHILCSNSQTKVAIGELPNFYLEYSGLTNGFLGDEVNPVID